MSISLKNNYTIDYENYMRIDGIFSGLSFACSIKNVCMGREFAVDMRAMQENMSLFGRTMAPGHLDRMPSELEAGKIGGGQGNAAREILKYKLSGLLPPFPDGDRVRGCQLTFRE